jgi:F-type H+-transporting ATPase subunit b
MNFKWMTSAAVLAAAIFAVTTVTRGQEPPMNAESGSVHADAPHRSEHEPDRNPMAFDPDLAVFSAIVFLLLLAVLGKFAWPSIVKALDERERKIADNIAAAEARHEEAKRLLAEHEAKLGAAAGEVRALLDEARRDADHTRRRIEEEGHKAAKDELARALREIERAKDAAVQDLAVASANTAIELARKVIQEELTPEKNNQLIREAAAKLAAQPSDN